MSSWSKKTFIDTHDLEIWPIHIAIYSTSKSHYLSPTQYLQPISIKRLPMHFLWGNHKMSTPLYQTCNKHELVMDMRLLLTPLLSVLLLSLKSFFFAVFRIQISLYILNAACLWTFIAHRSICYIVFRTGYRTRNPTDLQHLCYKTINKTK